MVIDLKNKLIFTGNVVSFILSFLMGYKELIDVDLIEELGLKMLIFAFLGSLGSIVATKLFWATKWEFPSLFYSPLGNQSAAQFTFYAGLVSFFSGVGACSTNLHDGNYLLLLGSGFIAVLVSYLIVALVKINK